MSSSLLPFILVTLLAVPVVAQRKADTIQSPPTWLDRYGLNKEWKQRGQMEIYDGSGRQYKQKRGDKMTPKMVVDTISFFDGVAVFALNTERSRSRVRLSARSEDDIHILSIFNVDVDSTVTSRTLDTITVYSASAANETLAEIKLMVQ